MERKTIYDTSAIPQFDRGMPIEVMKDFDSMLLFGRLASDSPEELVVGRISGEKDFPVCEPGSPVLVRGYDAQMNPILLRGRVARSFEMECTVGGLKVITYKTPRKSPRYPLAPPANVYVLEDAALDQPQLCLLLNISAGGACIVSEYRYEPEQPLRLQVALSKNQRYATAYHCQVVRVTPRPGRQFEYGLLFTQLDDRTQSCLTQDIQTIHDDLEKKMLS